MDSKCQYRSCLCQRFHAADKDDECKFCNHSIGFHEIINVNFSEHPYGKCKTCPCQRFKEEFYEPLRCYYCGHFQGFHERWPDSTTNFGPTQMIQSQQLTSPTGNTSRNVGRPTAIKIKISYLICFDKVSSNKVSKKGSVMWSNLERKNLIKVNVEIPQTDSQTIYDNICNLFGGRSGGQEFQLYSVRLGRPTAIKGFSFDLIKSNMTKANKRLYIGPTKFDINSPIEATSILVPPSAHPNTSLVPSDASTSSDVQNLPQQISNDPFVNQLFNGSIIQ